MEFGTEKIKMYAKELPQKALIAIKEKSGWILSLIFALVIGYSTYLWYIYAFNANWNDAKKQEYINTKQRDVNFDKDKFDSVITKIKQRRANYQKNINTVPDIFKFK